MKNIFFLISIVLLVSCNRSKQRIEIVEDENLTQVEIDSIVDQYTFKYDRLTFIDSTDIVLFPITTQNHTGKRFNKSSYSSSGYADHWNILFYNSNTTKTNLLTENKINIINFKTNIKEVDSTLESSILYEIINTDYNKDQEIDYKDPTYLFISKNDGTGFKMISSLNENVESYTIIPNTDKILIKATRDTDLNLEFEFEDDVIWYQVDVSKEEKPFELINPSERKKIESLYFKQWLVKNE